MKNSIQSVLEVMAWWRVMIERCRVSVGSSVFPRLSSRHNKTVLETLPIKQSSSSNTAVLWSPLAHEISVVHGLGQNLCHKPIGFGSKRSQICFLIQKSPRKIKNKHAHPSLRHSPIFCTLPEKLVQVYQFFGKGAKNWLQVFLWSEIKFFVLKVLFDDEEQYWLCFRGDGMMTTGVIILIVVPCFGRVFHFSAALFKTQ